MSIHIWLPFVLVVAFYCFAAFYNKQIGREVIWKGNVRKNVFSIILIVILFSGGIEYILDPNAMGRSITTTSYSYLYTGGRIIGFGVIVIAYTLFCFLFLNPTNLRTIRTQDKAKPKPDLQWVGYKIIFVLMCVTATLSGAYGFILRSCWGLFESRYIQDTFMWWAELGWCIAGTVGLLAYFKYIRFWNGEEKSK